MTSAPFLTFVSDHSHLCSGPVKSPCALAIAVGFALYVDKNELSLAAEEKVASYK